MLQHDQPPQKKRKVTAAEGTSRAASNMRRFGHGIFKTPYPCQSAEFAVTTSRSLPNLPRKTETDILILHYRYTVHHTLPILDWKAFSEQYEFAHRKGSLHETPGVWIGLLFSVFAVGTLHHDWREGREFLNIAHSHLELWPEELNLDHTRAALLISIFLVETNRKSAGWIWLGIASRTAFDIGLHCEAGSWSARETEMRRRLWWCIYACDWLVHFPAFRVPQLTCEVCCA